MLTETRDHEEIIASVAALDIGKAELMCCVRDRERLYAACVTGHWSSSESLYLHLGIETA